MVSGQLCQTHRDLRPADPTAHTASWTTKIAVAKTGEAAAVTASTAAWYKNPMFWAVAAIVASLALLIWSVGKLTDGFTSLTRVTDAATDAIRRFQEASHEVQKTIAETADNIVDVLTLEPLRGGMVQ